MYLLYSGFQHKKTFRVLLFLPVLILGQESIAQVDQTQDQIIESWTGESTYDSQFGSAITIRNGRVAIGAPNQQYQIPEFIVDFKYGATFSLDESKVNWVEGDELYYTTSIPFEINTDLDSWKYGYSLAMSDSHLAVGSPWMFNYRYSNGSKVLYYRSGAVRLYNRQDYSPFQNSDFSWLYESSWALALPTEDENFGAAVALTNSQLFVGAPMAVNSENIRGHVYVFDLEILPNPYANPVQTLVANPELFDGEASFDQFGAAISIDPSTSTLMAIGAPNQDNPQSPYGCNGVSGSDEGAVFIYRLIGGGWIQTSTLWPSTTDIDRGSFGSSVAISIDETGVERVVIGQPCPCIIGTGCQSCEVSDDAAGCHEGRVHVFVYTGNKWEIESVLESPIANPDRDTFGTSVSIQGWDIVVGTPNENIAEDSSVQEPGSVYRYTYSHCSDWTVKTRFITDNTLQSGHLGNSVAIENGWVVAGAPMTTTLNVDGDPEPSSGAAYTYRITPTPIQTCLGDFDSNGVIDLSDLLLLLTNFQPLSIEDIGVADITCDKQVNGDDVLTLLIHWGQCYSESDPPNDIQTCFDMYDTGTIELLDCLEALQ